MESLQSAGGIVPERQQRDILGSDTASRIWSSVIRSTLAEMQRPIARNTPIPKSVIAPPNPQQV